MTDFEDRIRAALDEKQGEAPDPSAAITVARNRSVGPPPREHRRATIIARVIVLLLLSTGLYLVVVVRGSDSTTQPSPDGCAQPPFSVTAGGRTIQLRFEPSRRVTIVVHQGDSIAVTPSSPGGCVSLNRDEWTTSADVAWLGHSALHQGPVQLQGDARMQSPWTLLAVEPGHASFDLFAVPSAGPAYRGPGTTYGLFNIRVLPGAATP